MESTEYFDVMSRVSEAAQDYLSVLNAQQLEAAVHEGSPLLILAGAGSGKTRVITTKIAYLIGERGVAPWQILAVTFTKKAANEMRTRAARLEPRSGESKILTFHSFGAWFLRTNAKAAGVAENFTVYDDDDVVQLLVKANPSLTKNRAGHYAHLISLAKDYCLRPEDDLSPVAPDDDKFAEVYARYQTRLRETGNVDFGDLIMLPYLTLIADDDVREHMRRRFRVVLVDEYQDSNVAQYLLLQTLTGAGEGSGVYVCVVGDDDQSIYRFRGAEIRNILTFSEKFPGTKVVRLERNYRSTAEILRIADDVVKNNAGRLGKTLTAERGHGKKPVLAFLRDGEEEAAEVVSLVQKSVRSGGRYSDWAVLYRTNAQSLSFETAFMQGRIPYQVVGSLKFYEREEVKDVLAYLSLLANGRDEVAFRRVVNKPPRGIGAATQDRIADLARQSLLYDAATGIPSMGVDFLGASAKIAPTLPKKARAGAESFVRLMDALGRMLDGEEPSFDENTSLGGERAAPAPIARPKARAQTPAFDFGPEPAESVEFDDSLDSTELEDSAEFRWIPTGRLGDLLWAVAERSGLRDYFRDEDDVQGTSRVENLIELANSAVPFDLSRGGLTAFLDHIELDRAQEDDGGGLDRVTLITLHNTKGLEFSRVVMTGMENGLFPRDDKSEEELEEERRLCYVGMTRARDELFLTCCSQRRLYGHTVYPERSRFLDEIDRDALVVTCSRGQEWKMRRFVESRHGRNGLSNPRFGDDSALSAKFRLGARVYHDDHGYGEITKTSRTDAGEYRVSVRFDNGETKSFLPKYSSHSLTTVED